IGAERRLAYLWRLGHRAALVRHRGLGRSGGIVRLGPLLEESQTRLADADFLAVRQGRCAGDSCLINARTVKRVADVADEPASLIEADFRMPAGGVLVAKNDRIIP